MSEPFPDDKAARVLQPWHLLCWENVREKKQQTRQVCLPKSLFLQLLANPRITDSSVINTRVKRRTRSSIVNDENENPFVIRRVRDATHDVGLLDADELADSVQTPTKSSRYTSVPVKHTIAGGRIALSPTKINSHFKTTKDVPSMF